MNKFLVVCLALLAAGAFASSVVEETQFEQVVSLSRSAPLIVLFYRSSNADAQQAQAVLDEVAASNTHPIKLLKCDGDLEANKQSYEGAGFGDKTFVFTAMGEEGITKYNGAIEAAAISQHIADKFLVGAEEDVLQFSTEGDFEALEGPVFVKCFEQWCGHCKSLKPGFVRSATALKQSAKFLEVECSKNDDTKQFCRKHNVNGYPTLLLFKSGADKSPVMYDSGDRSTAAFRAFIARHSTPAAAAAAADQKQEL